MLFFAVFMTANMVVMALVEEKSNRVAELLLSCVRAETLMAGKAVHGPACWPCCWSASGSSAPIPACDISCFRHRKSRSSTVCSTASPRPSPGQFQLLVVFFALSYLTVGSCSSWPPAARRPRSPTRRPSWRPPTTMVTLPVMLLPVVIAYDPGERCWRASPLMCPSSRRS